jgi:hypothetical protein
MNVEMDREGDFMYLLVGKRQIVRQKTPMAFGTIRMNELKKYLKDADDVRRGKTARGKAALIGIKNGAPMKPFNVGNMTIAKNIQTL